MEKGKNRSFIKWLEILQQESWQLELLISGFSIFLLAGAYDQIHILNYQIELLVYGNEYYGILYIPYQILLGAWYVLLINLITHVLLRGLWISTIGLRYISGDIDFDILKFSPKFDKFLKKKIVNFDLYIQQLEKLCSIVFAFTFLIIFILISGGLFVLGIIIMVWTMDGIRSQFGGSWLFAFLPFLLLYLLGGIIYFLDFLTLGWIKRRKRFARIYYPIYRFFGVITLAFVYRPIYYNLVDNKFGRKVVLFLIPYLIGFALFSALTFRTQAYLPPNMVSQFIGNAAYDDTWDENKPALSASIPSKFIENGFIQLYLPYNARVDDDVIEALCPDLKPAKTGIYFFGMDDPERFTMNADSVMACHSRRYKIHVNDTLLSNLKYWFYEHPIRKNIGLLTVLDVGYLSRGEHAIKVDVILPENLIRRDTLVFRQTDYIPFWKE